MLPKTMRVLEVPSHGAPSVARVGERPVPTPKDGEVLIKVGAAGLNFADAMQMRGLYPGGPKAPYVAGLEAAGTVVAKGNGARFDVGARVTGAFGQSFAEYVSWPSSALLPLPNAWSFGQGAAFFIQWLTAHGCLRTVGRLQANESVLIHAAAGGVGTAAVRLAKHFGARVFATASSAAKLALAKKWGADVLIDYTKEDFVGVVKRETKDRGVDLILEMVGGETFTKNFSAVVPYGRIVVFGSASREPAVVKNGELVFRPVEVSGYHITTLMVKRPDIFAAELEEVNALIANGVIDPEEPEHVTLEQASSAVTRLEERKTTGKVVIAFP